MSDLCHCCAAPARYTLTIGPPDTLAPEYPIPLCDRHCDGIIAWLADERGYDVRRAVTAERFIGPTRRLTVVGEDDQP